MTDKKTIEEPAMKLAAGESGSEKINLKRKVGMIDEGNTQSKYLLKKLKNEGKEVTTFSKGQDAVKECEKQGITDLYVSMTIDDWHDNKVAENLVKLRDSTTKVQIHAPLAGQSTKDIEKLMES